MDCDRHHRTPSSSSTSTTGSELFICFTSRRLSSSSSSMKISKSILSPGRPRHHDHHPPFSLSTSLSRRLRTNGSLKGGQSPMFPNSAKKRGCAFENPEPSSPKVTCIGQVRVKTRKKVEQTRSLSHRRRSGGEVSFSKADQPRDMLTQNQDLVHSQTQAENMGGGVQHQQQQQLQNQRDECLPHRNQRWVHFPLTICEGLRAFGAEFSCLFPCRSSCFSTTSSSSERDKEAEKSAAGSSEDGNASAQSGSCGAVFARWLVALHDGEGGKPRDIELVVGGRDEERTEVMEKPISMNSRRHVLEDIEFKDTEKCEGEEAARVSICIPPKNALLLMRCRSDPMKMASLTNRFWESPARSKELVEEEDKVEEKEDKGVDYFKSTLQEEENLVTENGELQQEENEVAAELVPSEVNVEELNPEKDASLEKLEVLENEEKQGQISQSKDELQVEIEQEILELLLGKEQEMQEESRMVEAEDELSSASSQANVDEKEAHIQNQVAETTQEKAEQESTAISLSKFNLSTEEDGKVEAEKAALDVVEAEEEQENSTEEKRTQAGYLENETTVTQEKEESSEFHEQENSRTDDDIAELEREKEEMNEVNEERESSSRGLPDCLLLMMCEPKLSMEVSKETWVCTTDFIRWLPHNRRTKVNPTDGPDRSKDKEEDEEEKKVKVKVSSIESDPALSLLQDKPPAPLQQEPPRSSCSPMATMIEQKLVNAVACEPFVLTRCKSEPMRSAAKLVPEACFWKNRKLEPHGRATFGFGAAGVGF